MWPCPSIVTRWGHAIAAGAVPRNSSPANWLLPVFWLHFPFTSDPIASTGFGSVGFVLSEGAGSFVVVVVVLPCM